LDVTLVNLQHLLERPPMSRVACAAAIPSPHPDVVPGPIPKIVSEVLGHKEVAITLDRYSHAPPTPHIKAMARLDAFLGR
jgi:hypothetical protein